MLNKEVIMVVSPLIREYYEKSRGFAPLDIEMREFGFGDYERKIAFRHYAFRDEQALRKYMIDNAPPFASYSTAFYRYPTARPMENKKLLGGELIFDLDSTDLRLPCQQEHGRDWICEKDLDAIKLEAIKLVEDFLIPDFGFSENDISINFSGNRGYHVHVNNMDVYALDGEARKRISDYISGAGLDLQAFFPIVPIVKNEESKMKKQMGPKPTDTGWGGKLARNFLATLDSGIEALIALGIEKQNARALYKKRALIRMGINNGNWDMVYIKNKMDFWKRISENQIIKQSDLIDKNVTKDMHHLIRLANTLHGDTGLVAKKIDSMSDLHKFEPMNEAIAFREGSMKVHANKVQKFFMKDMQFGPYHDVDVEVPTYAALYMLLKRVATL